MNNSDLTFVIPCRNESNTIALVISRIKNAFPGASIHVGNNGSIDNTAEIAMALGAKVTHHSIPGKAGMLRKMLEEVQSEYIVLVDGDNTYEIESVEAMKTLVENYNHDIVVGIRKISQNRNQKERPGHLVGNKMINRVFRILFNTSERDVLSGFRMLRRNFIEAFPLNSNGFELEVEMSAFASLHKYSVASVETDYAARPVGSVSKLNTYSDGSKIFLAMLRIHRHNRPLRHFGFIAGIFFLMGAGLVLRAAIPFVETGLVTYFPSLIVGTGLLIGALICITLAAILDAISQARFEIMKLISKKN